MTLILISEIMTLLLNHKPVFYFSTSNAVCFEIFKKGLVAQNYKLKSVLAIYSLTFSDFFNENVDQNMNGSTSRRSLVPIKLGVRLAKKVPSKKTLKLFYRK